MKISVQNEIGSHEWGCIPFMAEQWISELVERIKREDRAAAEAVEHEKREIAVVEKQGPALWRSFYDLLERYVADFIHDMGQDVTTLVGGSPEITLITNTNEIKIAKRAFPLVHFSARPNFPNRQIDIRFSTDNNYPGNVQPRQMPGRFEVEGETARLQLDGRPFPEVHEASRYIIEKLFRIPDKGSTI